MGRNDGDRRGAGGNRNVMVHGAYTAQRALEAGVLDELVIHQIPVLLGRGRRQFEVDASSVVNAGHTRSIR